MQKRKARVVADQADAKRDDQDELLLLGKIVRNSALVEHWAREIAGSLVSIFMPSGAESIFAGMRVNELHRRFGAIANDLATAYVRVVPQQFDLWVIDADRWLRDAKKAMEQRDALMHRPRVDVMFVMGIPDRKVGPHLGRSRVSNSVEPVGDSIRATLDALSVLTRSGSLIVADAGKWRADVHYKIN